MSVFIWKYDTVTNNKISTRLNDIPYMNYVYIMLNPDIEGNYTYGDYEFEYEPFYVGKGRYKCVERHFWESSLKKYTPKNKIIRGLLRQGRAPVTIILQDGLSSLNAHKLENNLIRLIGRKDLNEGVLLNRIGGKVQNL